MLKMTIDNEEVVSKNNFSIKEEMLSASSTILNNTYPKTWEQDHDYTSRFYYPKDYSRMTLNRETHILPEEGSNVEINGSTQLTNVDNTKEASITYLKGNTSQYTTTGKNLLPFPYTQNTTTINSIYCKVEQDGRVWTTGTASGLVQFNLYGGINTHAENFLANGTYILTGGFNSNKKITLRIERGSNYTYIDCDGTPKTFTIDSDVSALWCYINIASGQATGINFYPMIRLSSVSDATYEKGTGGKPSPSPSYPEKVEMATGNQVVNVASKNLYKYGDLAESSSYYFVDKPLLMNFKNNTTYTLSLDAEASIVPFNITIGYGSTGFQLDGPYLWNNQNGHLTLTFTTNNDYYKNLYIRVPRYGTSGTQWTATVKNIQLEYGDEETEYTPFISNNYSINLGKNLLSIPQNQSSGRGIDASWGGNTINVNGTNTYTSAAWIPLSNGPGANGFNLPNFLPGETYTISNTNRTSSSQLYFQINYYKGDTTTQGGLVSYNLANASQTFTVPNDYGRVASMFLGIYANTTTINNYTTKVMIERGSTKTDYADYFDPIELCKIGNYQDYIKKGKGYNLANINVIPSLSVAAFKRTVGDGVIKIWDNTNTAGYCTTERKLSQICPKLKVGDSVALTFKTTFDAAHYIYLAGYNQIWSMGATKTITQEMLDSTVILYGGYNQITYISEFMIRPSSISETAYEPYNCNSWYVYKMVGKFTANDTNWTYYSVAQGSLFRSDSLNIIYNSTCYSNYYTCLTQATRTNPCTYINDVNPYIDVIDSRFTSASDFKTKSVQKGVVWYVPLKAPMCSEITNTDLINQLESLRLLNGTNNITITSEDNSAITGLHYNYITEQYSNELIFSGIVKNTNNISLNPRQPKYCSLQILDNKTLLSEGNTLDFVISNKTILEAITMVVDAISDYGFQLGNVNILNGNEIIGTYSTENKTAYDVLQYLADISGAKWNCRRIDDTNMYIDFYDPSLMPRGKDIKYTTQWAQENNLVDLQFNYGTRDYRNKQVILSDEVIGDIDYTERVASDGMTKEFVLANNIAKIVKVEIDGVEQTVATQEEKDIGIYADFYYSINSNTITANKTLPYGSLIDITYTPVIKGREVVQSDNEIDRLNTQLGVNGTISRYESRNDETNSNKLLAIANTYLKYKGEAEITLTVKTHNNDLYQVGQTVYFDAPIDQLKKDYMVKSKEINVYVNNGLGDNLDFYDVFYTYTLSSSFNSEKAINWFDNQRAKNEGNIKENEFISRNIDINNNATIIWDNLQIEEISAIQGNNDLSAPVDAPIIH